MERASAGLSARSLGFPGNHLQRHRALPLRLNGRRRCARRVRDPAPAMHNASSMVMSALASTMSMLDNSVRKNGHSTFMRRSSSRASSPPSATNLSTALPKPYQPGNASRAWPHEKLKGWRADPRCVVSPFVKRGASRCSIRRFRDRRRGEEEAHEFRIVINQRAIGLRSTRWRASPRWREILPARARAVFSSVFSMVAATSVSRLR